SARASAIAGRNRPTPSLRVMKQTSLGLKKKRPAAPSSRTRRAIVCRTPFLEPTRLPNDQRRRQGLTLAAAPPLGGQRIHEPFGRALAELDDRHANRGEWWTGVLRDRNVIEPRDGDLVRHGDARLAQ